MTPFLNISNTMATGDTDATLTANALCRFTSSITYTGQPRGIPAAGRSLLLWPAFSRCRRPKGSPSVNFAHVRRAYVVESLPSHLPVISISGKEKPFFGPPIKLIL